MYKKEILTYGLAGILGLIVVAVAVFAFDFGQYGDLGEVPDDFLSQSCGVENGRYYYCKELPFVLNQGWRSHLLTDFSVKEIILFPDKEVTQVQIWMDNEIRFRKTLKDVNSIESGLRLDRFKTICLQTLNTLEGCI